MNMEYLRIEEVIDFHDLLIEKIDFDQETLETLAVSVAENKIDKTDLAMILSES